MTTGSFGPKASKQSEPLWLELFGYDQDENVVGPVRFQCKQNIQGAIISEALAKGMRPQHADVFINFIRDCIKTDEDQVRFVDLVHSDDFIIGLEDLGQVFAWLNEQYADRPTSPSADSWSGPTPTAATSTDGSTSTAPQTPSRWTQAEPAASSTPA